MVMAANFWIASVYVWVVQSQRTELKLWETISITQLECNWILQLFTLYPIHKYIVSRVPSAFGPLSFVLLAVERDTTQIVSWISVGI